MHMLCLAVLHPVLLLNILLCEYITYHCLLIDMWVISSLVLLQGVPLQAYVFMSSMHTLHISVAHIPRDATAGLQGSHLFNFS